YRRLRILDMETDVVLTLTSANSYAEDLPTGFVGFKSLYVSGVSNGVMIYAPPNIFHRVDAESRDAFKSSLSGETVYTIESGKLKVDQAVGATSDVVVNAVYFKRFLPLSDANTSNAALANHYDLFLSASLEQLWRWARKTEERVIAKTEVDRIIGEIEEEQTMLRMPPAPITTHMPRRRVS